MCALLLAAAPARPAAALVWNVPDDAPTIQAAIDMAIPGDRVVVACGVWLERVRLASGVDVLGASGNPACVVIDGGESGRPVTAEDLSEPVLLVGLTLTNGIAPPSDQRGGGLLVRNSTVELRNCRVVGNLAGVGGGIMARSSSLTMTGCTVEQNQAAEDSAIAISGGSATFTDSVFRNHGGSIGCVGLFSSAEATFERCVWSDNQALETAGALEVIGANATLVDCVLERNAGVFGGAIHLAYWGSIVVEGGRIADNEADVAGGGIYVDGVAAISLRLERVTVLANLAPAGPDGWVGASAEALAKCCTIEAGQWEGPLQIDEDCGVAGRVRSWGSLKRGW